MAGSLPDEVDVLVVGLGPVGATVASLLGGYGVRTLVVDRADEISLAPRAIALDHEALRILQLAGLPEGSFATVPIPYVRMLCPYVGEFARLDTSGTIDGHPKLATFHQPELERALRRVVASRASVTIATGVELEAFEDHGTGVSARLRTADGVREVRARFLVGADGASSRVRSGIGQDFDGRTYPEEWLVVDALDVPGSFAHVEFLCDPRRPTPHMVAPGGRTRWEFMLRPGETRAEMERDDTVRGLLRPWAGDGDVRLERKAVYRFHARSCDRYRVGSVFLAGDAAHVTPPFVGQGLVAGLRDAANLSWKLAWVVQGRVDASILDSYDEERRPHAARTLRLARLMGVFVMPRNLGTAVVLHGAMRLARLVPPVRRYVEELHVKPRHAFDRGLFVPGRGGLRRGGCFPQLRLRGQVGDGAWSDDLLGPGFALVGLGVDPSLRPETREAWVRLGGTLATIDAGGALAPALAGRAWCAVVRPDRAVLHDGPAPEAERLVRETLEIVHRAAA